MSPIQTAYINALLADASYVTVDKGLNTKAMQDRLTETQAAYLAANFEVSSSVETPQTLGSGFDAVVWQIKASSELAGTNNRNAGKVFVSTRGTQGLQDISDDVSLALRGIPHQQIADMVNWWLIETATVGSAVKQIRVQETGNLLSVYELVAGSPVTATRTGALAGVTNITAVNGHSLGGYLATAFTRLFGSQARVQAVNTFNSAGFANASAFNTETEFNKVATLLDLTGSFAAVGAIQTNYFAQNGLNFTTNSLADMRLPGFSQYGRRVGLEQEEATGLPNHSMYKLTDLLALGTVLEKLDPSLTIDKLNALSKAGSNNPAASLENFFDGVRRAIAGPGIEALPVTGSDVGTERAAFHATLAAFTKNPAIKDLEGKLLIRPTSVDLRAAARNDFGALIALRDLSPLYISGTTAAAQNQLTEIWQISRAADYAAWLADKSTATPITFTDQWITDRAALLQAIVTRNKLDNTNGFVYDAAAPVGQVSLFQWYGAEPPIGQTQPGIATLSTSKTGVAGLPDQFTAFGDGGSNRLDGTNNKLGDHLYGDAGDDTTDGRDGADYLEGNLGNDVLNGGDNDKANDALIGGQGNDTYKFTGTYGIDTVFDSDGLGSIQIDGDTLTGGAQYGDNRVYRSADKKHLYVLANDNTLLIDNQIVVQSYNKSRGDLGLSYSDAPAQSNPSTTRDIKGDLKPADNDPVADGIQTTLDDIGNIVVSTEVLPDRLDTLNDSTGNDHITSGGGNDDIYLTKGGDNWVEAGTGKDWVRGGVGKDLIEGGTGADAYYRLSSCLRLYLLACSQIRYPKTAQKASRDVQASCRRTRSDKRFTINLIAACARKQGVRGRFSSQKRPKNHQTLPFNQSATTARSLKGQTA